MAIHPQRREPSGRKQRCSTVQYLAQLEREREETEKVVVLAQPHRRGERDQKAATALGRLCLKRKLEPELYQAGEAYAALVRNWRIAKGIPVEGKPGPSSRGAEPDDATVTAWGRRILELEERLQEHPGIYGAIGWLIFSDQDPWPVNEPACVYGLRLLADELDLLTLGKHPYEGRRA